MLQHAVCSQITYHGFDPEDALIKVEPRSNENITRVEDILTIIEEQGDQIALVLIGGVQYYTGQFFDLPSITKAAHVSVSVIFLIWSSIDLYYISKFFAEERVQGRF